MDIRLPVKVTKTAKLPGILAKEYCSSVKWAWYVTGLGRTSDQKLYAETGSHAERRTDLQSESSNIQPPIRKASAASTPTMTFWRDRKNAAKPAHVAAILSHIGVSPRIP